MKLEFLDATGNGKFPNASPKTLIRLSEFTEDEKESLILSIKENLIKENKILDLHQLRFVESIDCKVSLKIGNEDAGLVKSESNNQYVCILSRQAYENMAEKISLVGDGHNWLTPGEYLDEPSLLISKWGPW